MISDKESICCGGSGLRKEYLDWAAMTVTEPVTLEDKDKALNKYCNVCINGVLRSYFNANRFRIQKKQNPKDFRQWCLIELLELEFT